jgi:hypothetical protein
VTIYNKQARKAIDTFIGQANGHKPAVFQNIKIRYSETNGLKTYIYPNNRCDLYLFDNYLAIIRRSDFIIKVFFPPIVLTSDISTTKNIFGNLETYKPDQLKFKQIVKGEVEIKINDPTYNNYSRDITLKELSNEQTTQLEKIKNWC